MFTPLFLKRVALDFARTFLATFLIGLPPVVDFLADKLAGAAVDWSYGATLITAAAAAALSAAVRAVQAQKTTLETDPRLKP